MPDAKCQMLAIYAAFGIITLSYTQSNTAVTTPTAIITHHIPVG